MSDRIQTWKLREQIADWRPIGLFLSLAGGAEEQCRSQETAASSKLCTQPSSLMAAFMLGCHAGLELPLQVGLGLV